MALVRSLAKQLHTFLIILRHSQSGVVTQPEVVFRRGATLLGSLPEPRYGLSIILGHRIARVIPDPHRVLRIYKAAVRSSQKQLRRSLEVFCDTRTLEIASS